MSVSRPPAADPARPGRRRSWWNLLLLVPLLMLVTPWYNADHPRLAGLPMFYWFQFLFVPVGVACVGIVAAATRDRPARPARSDGDAEADR